MTTATQVRERPILFSGPMVRAILDGRKTQTRRVVQTSRRAPWHRMEPAFLARRWTVMPHPGGGWWGIDVPDYEPDGKLIPGEAGFPCPYGQPGDRLWVRETWARCPKSGGHYLYAADGDGIGTCHVAGGRWRPSIHMPRAACRLTLEITGVRVERLQAISGDDAEAEGIDLSPELYPNVNRSFKARAHFQRLWDSINAARGYGWDANPWVWVITFRPEPRA